MDLIEKLRHYLQMKESREVVVTETSFGHLMIDEKLLISKLGAQRILNGESELSQIAIRLDV